MEDYFCSYEEPMNLPSFGADNDISTHAEIDENINTVCNNHKNH